MMNTTATEGTKQWASNSTRLVRERWAEGQIVYKLVWLKNPKYSRQTDIIPVERQKPGLEEEVLIELATELRGYLREQGLTS
jgi:hypothetical protein